MKGGLGKEDDRFHLVNFRKSSGEATSVDATSSLAIFIAPVQCEIIDVGLAVTTSVAAHGTNTWSIQIVNQTGNLDLLSAAFDTDSANSGNGGRSLTEDTLASLCDSVANNKKPNGLYLQNAVLAKGDVLVLTATEANTATALANPVIVIKYRT